MKIDKEGMRKLKASIANIALFLSIFVVLFPLALQTVSAGYDKTIFVDDDAPPGGDGSETNPFDEIGLAVEDAFGYSGAVLIRVYAGTYNETITIGSGASWDNLTLEGNGSDVTTIDARSTGTVITISASWVTVTGFTIKNATTGYGIIIGSNKENVKIYDNNITNNENGIYLNGLYHNIISNNINSSTYSGVVITGNNNNISYNNITNSTKIYSGWVNAGIHVAGNNNNITWNQCFYSYNWSGIYVGGSGNNISNNTIGNSYWGINLYNEPINNLIYKNTINNNLYGIRSLGPSSYNTIDNNTIIYNNEHGISMTNSHNETIINNHIENNTKDGINIIGGNDFNITDNNYINNNGDDGIEIKSSYNSNIDGNYIINSNWSGIKIESSTNITILNNNISSLNSSLNNNPSYGITLVVDSNNIHIKNNTIYDNNGSCVYISSSNNNFVYDNNVLTTSEYGVYLISSDGNYINNSYILNNTYGIRLDNSNNNTITSNNQIFNSTIDGIYLNSSSGSHWNKIIGNNISNNTESGVRLSGSNNNTICSNDIYYNSNYGISLIDSKDNTICNNSVFNNTIYGLYIEGDYRNYITDNNTIHGEQIYYIYNKNGSSTQLNDTIKNKILTLGANVTNVGKINFIYSSYFYVYNNSISNASRGIFLYESNNITFHNNTIFDIDENNEYGFYIEENYRHYIAQNNTVNGEKIYYYYNWTGTEDDPLEVEIPAAEQPLNASHVSNVGKISIIDSSYLLIKNNNLSNGYYGIFLNASQELTLWNNTINNSEVVGFYISEGHYHQYITSNNSVNGENIYYFTDNQSIVIEDFQLETQDVSNVGKLSFINCSNLTIQNNILNNNYGSGIFIHASSNVTIYNNTVRDNSYGITVHTSHNSINVTENIAITHDAGVFIYKSNQNIISNNSIINCDRGIYLLESKNNKINDHWETINTTTSTKYSIYIEDSSGNRILNNNFSSKATPIFGLDSSPIIENNSLYRTGGRQIILHNCNNKTKILNNTITYYDIDVYKLPQIWGMHVAIFLINSSPLIENNTSIYPYIPTNVSRKNGNNFANKGHMSVYFGSKPIIRNNRFYGNSWGISMLGNTWALIEGNEINGTDIAIQVASSDQLKCGENKSNTASYAIINNNYINNTHAWAIRFTEFNNGIVTNNTILNGGGPEDWAVGFGVYIMGKSNPYIAFNNISYNYLGIKSIGSPPYPYIEKNTVTNNNIGIYTQDSDSTLKIEKNLMINNIYGISGWDHSNFIAYNTLVSNDYGILVNGIGSPLIVNNFINSSQKNGINVTYNASPTINNNYITLSGQYGIYIQNTTGSLIYHNNMINNTYQAYDNTNNSNQWDNGYPSGGNYWSDFDEPSEGAYDDYHGPNQDILGSDGIVDNGSAAGGGMNPYVIDADSQDNYPLMDPWGLVLNVDKDLWYFTISEAISEADSGNALEAMMGTYQEKVVVNKTLTITGRYGATRTIIDGGENGDVIYITGNWVNITGFTVTGSGSNMYNDAGVEINNAQHCYIAYNNISTNELGVYVDNFSNAIIDSNTILFNSIGILSHNSSSVIQYNDISYNYIEGIGAFEYSNTYIGNNTIIHNYCIGIAEIHYSNAIIDNNTISHSHEGIAIGESSPIIITYNNITFNTIGIETYLGSNATVHWNNIHNNTEYGVNNWDSSITINATDNWWGDSSGPYHPITNPFGLGDRVSDDVIYRPFAPSSIEDAGPQ